MSTFCNLGETPFYNTLPSFLEGETQVFPPMQGLSTAYRRRGWLNPLPAIVFSESLGESLWDRVKEYFLGDFINRRAIYDDLLDLGEPIRSVLHSFLVDLWAYQESVWDSHKVMSVTYIARQSLREGPAFAKIMDKYKELILDQIMERVPFKKEETYICVSGIDNRLSIGDIYRPDFLFKWEAPELDIREVTSTPVEINQDIADRFRQCLMKYLRRPEMVFLEEVPFEFLLKDSNKKCINGAHYNQPICQPADKRGRSKVCHIQTSLKEKRAAVLEEYPSLLRIQWINENVANLLSCDRRSVRRYTAETLHEKLREALSIKYRQLIRSPDGKFPPRTSYCRDFKKRGVDETSLPPQNNA